jgi:hypothetical protein
MSGKTKTIIEAAAFISSALLDIYLLYALIANFAIWLAQPRFVLESGKTTASFGFLVIFIIYAGISAVVAALQATALILLKKHKKKKALKI